MKRLDLYGAGTSGVGKVNLEQDQPTKPTPKRDALIAKAQRFKGSEIAAQRKAVAGWILLMPEKSWAELWPAFKKMMVTK